jgi:simple sugar transport system permease protein
MSAALLSPNASKGAGGDEDLAAPLVPISYRAPIAYGLLTVVAGLGFGLGLGSTQRTKFSLASKTDLFQLPDFAIPSQAAVIVLVLGMAALTVWAFRQAMARLKTRVWLPSVFGLFWVLAFMVWVIADKPSTWTIPALLAASLSLSIPLVFGSLTGLVCERVGVINVAIEGQLMFGAFLAAVVASMGGSAYWGKNAAPLAGALEGA